MPRKPFKRREQPGRCLGSRSSGVRGRGDASEAVQAARVSEAKTARKMRGVLRAQIGRPCRDVPALLQVKFAGERFGSGDGERKTLLTQQIAFEPLPPASCSASGCSDHSIHGPGP